DEAVGLVIPDNFAVAHAAESASVRADPDPAGSVREDRRDRRPCERFIPIERRDPTVSERGQPGLGTDPDGAARVLGHRVHVRALEPVGRAVTHAPPLTEPANAAAV